MNEAHGVHIFFEALNAVASIKGWGGKKQTQSVYLMFLMGSEKLKMGFRFILSNNKKKQNKKKNTSRSPDMMKSKS